MRLSKLHLSTIVSLLLAITMATYLRNYQWFSTGEAMFVAFVLFLVIKTSLLVEEMYVYRGLK